MYCVCRKKGSSVYYDLTGQTNELQVHSDPNCRRPPRAYFDHFTSMRCPKEATALIHVFSRNDGINEITFACVSGEKKKVYFVGKNPDMLFKLWEMLDQCVNEIKSDSSVSDEYYKSRARALADAISLIMPMSADDVVREALNRFKHRIDGNESYETPGLAEEVYQPKPVKRVETATVAKSRAKRTGKSLPPTAIPSIRKAIDTKVFTVAQIAKSYDLSTDEVKEQLGLA